MVGAGVDAHGGEGGGYRGFLLLLLLLEFRRCWFRGVKFVFRSGGGAGGWFVF